MSLTGLISKAGVNRRCDLRRPILNIALMFFFLCAWMAGQAAPERKVDGSLISSKRDPAVEIQLPRSAQYIGADRWILYGIADCELHGFIEADAKHNVERLYWVQFEGYVPSKPGLKHTYDSPQHAQIGGMEFYVDTWARANNEATTSGSEPRAHRVVDSRARLSDAARHDVCPPRASAG